MLAHADADGAAQHVNHATNRRSNQKTRTRRAIIDASRELIRAGGEVSMPAIAKVALVSEATAYRYFPDLTSLLNEALVGLWPSPAEALTPINHSTDPVERIAFASAVFLRRVLAYQGAVRAMAETLASGQAVAFAQLKRDLSVIVSPESLFTLTDLCGLSPDEAIASLVQLATTVTTATMRPTTSAPIN